MDNNINIINISPGIELINLPTDIFKTAQISVTMAVPLRKETASVNALTTYLLSRSCEQYRDFSLINKKLAELYGASLGVQVRKIGDNQILKIGVSALDDRFALDDEKISYECIKLLLSMLFTPNLSDGAFPQESVEMEKRLLIERIESEINEKRRYALLRLEEEMFKDEYYSINPLGSIEEIKKITPDDVIEAWVRILTTSKILISVVGRVDHNIIADTIEKTFSDIYRSYEGLPSTQRKNQQGDVKVVEERLDINQGKLVLGFRVEDENINPSTLTSAVDVFGGGPYSRLFVNVREKMSLCYYCSASPQRQKGVVYVQCGCEEENMDKAINEICSQLKCVADNEFTDEEFNASKMAIGDAIMGFNDNPYVLENWYVQQILDDEYITPEQKAVCNKNVTKEEIALAASKIKLDTVYKLMCKKEEN